MSKSLEEQRQENVSRLKEQAIRVDERRVVTGGDALGTGVACSVCHWQGIDRMELHICMKGKPSNCPIRKEKANE